MKKLVIVLLALCMVTCLTVSGCGTRKAESGTVAIEKAKTMKTAGQQEKYLLDQAQAFINAKEFQFSIDVTQYVLKNVDKNSKEARELLRKAQDAMAVELQRMVKKP